MHKLTSLLAVVFALVVLLVSTSGVFAQVQLHHFDDFVEPESCVICHPGAGSEHQAIYDDYADESTLELTVDSVVSVENADGTFDTTDLGRLFQLSKMDNSGKRLVNVVPFYQDLVFSHCFQVFSRVAPQLYVAAEYP